VTKSPRFGVLDVTTAVAWSVSPGAGDFGLKMISSTVMSEVPGPTPPSVFLSSPHPDASPINKKNPAASATETNLLNDVVFKDTSVTWEHLEEKPVCFD
jgi:hypothetical protein